MLTSAKTGKMGFPFAALGRPRTHRSAAVVTVFA